MFSAFFRLITCDFHDNAKETVSFLCYVKILFLPEILHRTSNDTPSQHHHREGMVVRDVAWPLWAANRPPPVVKLLLMCCESAETMGGTITITPQGGSCFLLGKSEGTLRTTSTFGT